MKNSIQFKHFRKFEDFPRLDFNDITYLVGKNNSGKSTFVKAFLMIYNYLKASNLKALDLNQGSVEFLNIVTFDRALCKTMSQREQKYHIPITLRIGNYEFFLNVTGKSNSTILDVIEFKVIDYASNFTLLINPIQEQVTIYYSSIEKKESDALQNAIIELESVKKDLDELDDELSKTSIELKMHFEKLTKIIESFDKTKVEEQSSFTISEFYSANTFNELFEDLYATLEKKYFIQNPNVQQVNNKVIENEDADQQDSYIDNQITKREDTIETEEKEFDDLRYYYINRQKFESFFKRFVSLINLTQVFYLPATLNKQSALLSIRDKNNDLAEMVHKYYQLNLIDDPIISSFVRHWLAEFQIGSDIRIELINGEAYSITLIENDMAIALADKGMGSIQAVLLILRMASVISFHQGVTKKNVFEYFVIVEEPELNLHPALQSKLCDLFFEVYEKYRIKFIIETHSEYIIRRSQVLNAQKEFALDNDAVNPTPFSTIYFNSDLNSENTVYSMDYQPDGTFEKAFGEGFFDASSSSTLELIRLRRQKNK